MKDASEGRAVELKTQGNKLFMEKEYGAAIGKYDEAIVPDASFSSTAPA